MHNFANLCKRMMLVYVFFALYTCISSNGPTDHYHKRYQSFEIGTFG